MFVYVITNTIDGKMYVGKTSGNIKNILSLYLSNAKYDAKKPRTAHTPHIGQALMQHGREHFTIRVLEECATQKEADICKEKWIQSFNTLVPHGYNLQTIVDGKQIPHSNTIKRVCGEKNVKAKLTEEQVLQIIQLDQNGFTQEKIRSMFPATRKNIGSIVTGKSWKHLPRFGVREKYIRTGEHCPMAKLTEKQVIEIIQRCYQGVPQVELSTLFNVSISTISRIINGSRWTYLPRPLHATKEAEEK